MKIVVRTTGINDNQLKQMHPNHSPCELILKIGCNEYDEISAAIATLLRSCSINDQNFFSVERHIQPTTYFGSFTSQSSASKTPIQCQSLSCVLFLTNNINNQQFKSNHIWNFHHKIELLNEYKQSIARQDYYELSRSLPLWSISSIPNNQQIIVRFNIFTKNFDLMLKFYQYLFQRKPDSSKTGFVLFNLSFSKNVKLFYQFSIKYSPAIQPYTISHGAYLKFRLNNLNDLINEYTRRLFMINKSEYYIYDPDGNLLHLDLQNSSSSSNLKEYISSKAFIHTNDSGIGGDSSDPSMHLRQIHSINNDIDVQSHSSNDSGRWSSISSNEIKRTIQRGNNISVRSGKKNEDDYQRKQRIAFPRVPVKQVQWKPSLYDSEPRLSFNTCRNNRYYSSMNNVPKSNRIRPLLSANHFKSIISENSNNYDISYDVDYPHIQSETLTNSSSFGYLNAFLLKKRQRKEQQSICSQNVKQLIHQFERSNSMLTTHRPKSVPLINQPSKNIVQPPIISNSSRKRSESVTSGWQNYTNDPLKTIDHTQTPRINIGITLDSRLRKTPVLDMLRSTTMKPDIIESKQLNRTNSLRQTTLPIARF